MTGPVSVRRMAELSLAAFEVALLAGPGNGGGQASAEVRWTLSRLAQAAPGMALRLPTVRRLIDPVVLATVTAQVRAQAGTPQPVQPHVPAQSETASVGAAKAARAAGVSPRAARAAAQRGTLPGRKHPHTGEWLFNMEDVRAYAGKRRGRGTHSGGRAARRD